MSSKQSDDQSQVERTADRTVVGQMLDVEGKVVLDVGSGAGGLTSWLRANGATAIGVECSSVMLGEAKRAGNGVLRFVRGVGQQLPMPDDRADIVIFFNSLHHVPADDMDTALAEAVRVLRPGGTVYVLEPVAEGPGFEVGRIIDDETEVRALAQDALDRVEGRSLNETARGRYLSEYVYRDFDAYEAVMIGVDGSRRQQVVEHREAVRAAFERHGRTTDEGVAFDHPMFYRVFSTAVA